MAATASVGVSGMASTSSRGGRSWLSASSVSARQRAQLRLDVGPVAKRHAATRTSRESGKPRDVKAISTAGGRRAGARPPPSTIR